MKKNKNMLLNNTIKKLMENKKETLEQAAKEFANNSAITNYEEGINVGKYQGFINGAKWQQERMYSEEDMKSFGEFCADYDYRCFGKHTQEEMLKIWFEQFKKK